MTNFIEDIGTSDLAHEESSQPGSKSFGGIQKVNTDNSYHDNGMKWSIEHKDVTSEKSHNIVSVFDVAAYILQIIKSCTTMKMQKLLYYCQAWYLVWNDKPLFYEKIEAWANGPVVRQLYQFHKGLFIITLKDMTLGNPNKLSEDQKSDIDSVLDAYGGKSSQWLVEQTHMEAPWRNARKGISPTERGNVEITHQDMAEYYSSLYGQEEE